MTLISNKLLKISYILHQSKNRRFIASKIKIVPIKKENEEQLKLILEGCNLDSIASEDELWTLQDVKDTIKRNYKHFFLLYSDEEIIGMCTISGNALSGFAIFNRYQGKGYGKQSLKAIIEKMKADNGEKEIILRVAKNNIKAINLYKSCGFEVIKDDEMDEKSFRMILKP